MDEHQLIVEIVKAVASLAWPGVVALAIWLFRKEIVRMLPHMRVKYKDAEIDFRFAQAEHDAQAVPSGPAEKAPKPTPEEEDRFRQLARIEPRAAILEMRRELEEAMFRFAERHGLVDGNRPMTIMSMTRHFRAKKLITPEVSALLDDVRSLGNSAAHERGKQFTFEDAERFRKLWQLALAQFC
jgi:hypothetical protein